MQLLTIALTSMLVFGPIGASEPKVQDDLVAQQGGGAGILQDNLDGSVRAIENAISTYLDGREVQNILTPGEFSEWSLTLEEGQVVIAEARSDAFDPAIQIVDPAGKVLYENDDRYPGDQRPLLFWRAPTRGAYGLRVTGFRGKAGGQFFLRHTIYDTIDVGTERPFEKPKRFLVRVPMKAGEVEQVYFDTRRGYSGSSIRTVIGPTGLPDLNLARPLWTAIPNAIVAPVDGDYYLLSEAAGGKDYKIRPLARIIQPVALQTTGGVTVPANAPVIAHFTIKAGEFFEISAPALRLGSPVIVTEAPDVSQYDLKKPDGNPFFPKPSDKPRPGPAFTILPGRARDSRVVEIYGLRDATIWLASDAASDQTQIQLNSKPAARPFAEGAGLSNKLVIGKSEYWAIDAQVGDVMLIQAKVTGFAPNFIFRGPTLDLLWQRDGMPDETQFAWNVIIRQPGRHLLAVSSIGGGGGGDYELSRKVFPAKTFAKGSAAAGDLSDGQTHVWKFVANPREPMLMKWTSSDWDYEIHVSDMSGNEVGFNFTRVDEHTQFAILKVDSDTPFLVVLIPRTSKAKYSIELTPLPGYGG